MQEEEEEVMGKNDLGYSIFNETMADMTWPEVKEAAKNDAVILLPTGVIEQHGPHLCTGVDTYLGYIFGKQVKQKLDAKNILSLMVPPLYWGVTIYSRTYPGTFACRPETVKAVLHDVLDCLHEWGFKNVFAFTWHQNPDHGRTVMEAMKDGQDRIGINSCYLIRPGSTHAERFGLTGKEDYALLVPKGPAGGPPPKYADVHAGKEETGAMSAHFPDLVNAGMAKTLESNDKTFQDLTKWGTFDPPGLKNFMGQGYIGAPADFDAESAESDLEESTTRTADTIESFLKGS
jgi:creatinine amidohydrolase